MKSYYSLLFITLLIFLSCDYGDDENLTVLDINPNIKEVIVFQNVPNERPIYRIPSVCITNKKTVLIACENRQIFGDIGDVDILLARQVDESSVWVKQTLFKMSDVKGRSMAPIFLVDRRNGRIYLFVSQYKDNTKVGYLHTTDETDMVYKYSDDDGETWSEEFSLKDKWNTKKYTSVVSSVANGITLEDGTYLIPTITINKEQMFSSLLIKRPNADWYYSSYTPNEWDNECTVYIDNDNQITLDCRTNGSYRNKYHYDLEHDTFTQIESDIIDSYIPIKAEITKIDWKDSIIYLMSYPNTIKGTRENMSLFGSINGIYWKFLFQFEQGYNGMGYSNVAYYNDKVVIVYESHGQFIKFTDISFVMNDIVNLIYK